VTSMEERNRRLAVSARNPQRRPVLTSCGRPPRADEAPPAPGRVFGTINSVVTGASFAFDTLLS